MRFARAVRRCAFGSILAAIAGGWPVSLLATALGISPVIIDMKSPREAPAITVTNRSHRAILLQADTLIWRQENDSNVYERTDELLAVPAIAEIAPNSSQIFRVALRAPAHSPVERTYRLLLEDITGDAPPEQRKQLELRLNHNLPVMIAPSGQIVRALRWKPCPTLGAAGDAGKPAQQVCLRVQNKGNRRVKMTAVTLSGEGWEQTLQLGTDVNVLAGAEREWHVPLAAGHKEMLLGVRVRTAEGETLRAELEEF